MLRKCSAEAAMGWAWVYASPLVINRFKRDNTGSVWKRLKLKAILSTNNESESSASVRVPWEAGRWRGGSHPGALVKNVCVVRRAFVVCIYDKVELRDHFTSDRGEDRTRTGACCELH